MCADATRQQLGNRVPIAVPQMNDHLAGVCVDGSCNLRHMLHVAYRKARLAPTHWGTRLEEACRTFKEQYKRMYLIYI